MRTKHEEGTISIKFFVSLVGCVIGPNKLIALLRDLKILESDNMPSNEVLFKYLSYSTEYFRGGRKKATIPRVITKGGITFLSKILSERGLLDPAKRLSKSTI